MSQSSATSSTQGGRPKFRGIPKMCWCGATIVEQMSKSVPNPYRRYYRCSYAASKRLIDDNHTFNWIDTASAQEIEQLQYEVRLLAEEVQMIKRSIVGSLGSDYGELEKKLDTMEKELVESKSNTKKMMVVIFCGCALVIGMMVKSKVD